MIGLSGSNIFNVHLVVHMTGKEWKIGQAETYAAAAGSRTYNGSITAMENIGGMMS